MESSGPTERTPWEEAVLQYCAEVQDRQPVLDNYFDEDVVEAAKRFAESREFAETLKLISGTSGKLLEIGAGRGIASYAFAVNGYSVTALEPDPGEYIGSGAIRILSERTGVKIRVVKEHGERLSFEDSSFDVVYVRQVLHHASDMRRLCAEVARVLKRKGVFVAVREHVVDNKRDLEAFLNSHPLHHRYGGENAFTVDQYKAAMACGGLRLKKILAPFDSDINLYPSSKEEIKDGLRVMPGFLKAGIFLNIILKTYNRTNRAPGRLYSFVARKR